MTSVLLLASACNGDDKKTDTSPTSAAPATDTVGTTSSVPLPTATPFNSTGGGASASAPASKPAGGSGGSYTKEQLEKVILGKADFPATSKVIPYPVMDPAPKAANPACDKIIQAFSGFVDQGRAKASTSIRYINNGDESDVRTILLAAYAPGDAAKVIAELKAGNGDCGNFPATQAGATVHLQPMWVTAEGQADETFALELKGTSGSQNLSTMYEFVRVGDMLAVFADKNRAKPYMSLTPDEKTVNAQVAKMRAAK
ncbi:hypothetical protein [Yinghuangia seranimata]|uniref:hypothetical protein n=1 Tax=Yinghuangia seranimata TaxID=408067 RepID=UPI00248B26B5|nr:hypothetical protein [Yinghuangia seranimata]MDI2130952.1 hypothetical protein [Yinghuangia seranimata]